MLNWYQASLPLLSVTGAATCDPEVDDDTEPSCRDNNFNPKNAESSAQETTTSDRDLNSRASNGGEREPQLAAWLTITSSIVAQRWFTIREEENLGKSQARIQAMVGIPRVYIEDLC